MKQLQLLDLGPEEMEPKIPLDPDVRDELVTLIALAIECVYSQEVKGDSQDDRFSASHEDQ